MLRLLAFCSALLALPIPALAKKPPKMVVLELPSDGNFKPSVMKAINDFLAGSLRDQGFDVVTPSDIAAVLGLERQKQLLGCSESSCLAEIGGALGAEFIVSGNVAVLGESTAVNLTVLDSKGSALNRVREIVKSRESADIIQAIERLVPKLVEPIPVSKAHASPAAAVSTAPSEPSRAVPYALLGTGAACLVASGVFGVMAKGQADTATKNPYTTGTASQIDSDTSGARTKALISTVALGAGVVSAGVGAAMLLFGGSSAEHTAMSSAGGPALAWSF